MRQAALRPPEPPRHEAEAQRDPQHPLGCPQPGEAEIPPKNRGLNTWSLPLIAIPFVPCFVRHPAARGPSRSWCFRAVFHLLQSTSSTTAGWEMTFSGCPALLLALSCITTVLRGGEGAAGCWRSHSPPQELGLDVCRCYMFCAPLSVISSGATCGNKWLPKEFGFPAVPKIEGTARNTPPSKAAALVQLEQFSALCSRDGERRVGWEGTHWWLGLWGLGRLGEELLCRAGFAASPFASHWSLPVL